MSDRFNPESRNGVGLFTLNGVGLFTLNGVGLFTLIPTLASRENASDILHRLKFWEADLAWRGK